MLPILEEAAKRNSRDFDALEATGEILLSLGRTPEAVDTYRKVLREFPNREFSLGALAEEYARTGRHRVAIGYWQRVIAVNPWMARYWHGLARSYAALDQWNECLDTSKEAAQRFPTSVGVRQLIVESHLEMDQPDQAKQAFDWLRRFRPDDFRLNRSVVPRSSQAVVECSGCTGFAARIQPGSELTVELNYRESFRLGHTLMQTIIFEDEFVAQLAPISLSRPAYAITCGGYRLYDLLEECGAERNRMHGIVRPHVAALQQADFPDLGRPMAEEPALLINARLAPTVANARAIKQLGQHPFKIVGDECLVAAFLPAAYLAKVDLTEGSRTLLQILEDVPSVESPMDVLSYPHDVVRIHMESMAEECAASAGPRSLP